MLHRFGSRKNPRCTEKVNDELRSIYSRIKVSRVTEGILYYEVLDGAESHVSQVIHALGEEGFLVTIVTDSHIKELLPCVCSPDPSECVVLRIEWSAMQVRKLWPGLKFSEPFSLYNVSQPWTLRSSLKVCSALFTLLFILGSFACSFFNEDSLISRAFITCGIGCFLLLCLVAFLDHE
jgi:hypothetical protein